MKRIIGIILIFLGVALGIWKLVRHEQDKTIIDLGNIEVKDQRKEPSQNNTLYYVLAAACMIGGGLLLTGKKI